MLYTSVFARKLKARVLPSSLCFWERIPPHMQMTNDVIAMIGLFRKSKQTLQNMPASSDQRRSLKIWRGQGARCGLNKSTCKCLYSVVGGLSPGASLGCPRIHLNHVTKLCICPTELHWSITNPKNFRQNRKISRPPPPARKLRWSVLVCEKIIFGVETCAIAHFFGAH